MSDAKKFAKLPPLTADERLDEIERKYGVIQQRIQAYDEVLERFAALTKELKQSQKDTASLHDFFESFCKEIRTTISSLLGQIQPLKNTQEGHERTLKGHSSSINSMINHATDKHVELKMYVDDMGNRLCTWANDHVKIQTVLDDVNRKLSEVGNRQVKLVSQLDNLYADHFKFKEKSESVHANLDQCIDNMGHQLDNAPDLNDWASKLYSRFTSDMTYRDKQNMAYADKKVDQLAQDFAVNPLSAESIKNQLLSEMQSIALDSKNAYLKSNNCAQQIQLFEKKLENLNLIIKKYELNK